MKKNFGLKNFGLIFRSLILGTPNWQGISNHCLQKPPFRDPCQGVEMRYPCPSFLGVFEYTQASLKTPTKDFSSPYKLLKSLGDKQKALKKTKEFPSKTNTKETKAPRKRRTGTIWQKISKKTLLGGGGRGGRSKNYECHTSWNSMIFREGDEDSNFSVFRVRRFTEWRGLLTELPLMWKSLPNPSFTECPSSSPKKKPSLLPLTGASSYRLPKWLRAQLLQTVLPTRKFSRHESAS